MAKPIEQESLKVPFFALSVIMLIITMWSLLDEFVLRRDWKLYQREFKKVELDRAAKDLEETKKALISHEFPETWDEAEIEKAKQFPPLTEIEKNLADAEAKLDKGALAKLDGDLKEIHRKEYLANIEYQNAKSEDLEWWYHYTHAVDTGDKKGEEHARGRLDEIKQDIEARHKTLLDLRAEAQKVQAQREDLTAEADKWRQMRGRVTDRIGEAQAKYDKIYRRSKGTFWWFFGDDDVVQYVIRGTAVNEFNEQQYVVDRCETCHYAINKPGWEKTENKLFQSHPWMDEILTTHAPDKFGCTSCHGGQGYALEPVDEAHGTIHYWDWPLLGKKKLEGGHHFDEGYDAAMVQSSCVKCHITEYQVTDRSPDPWTGIEYQKTIEYASEVNNGREAFEKLGCWGCHQAKGFEVLDEIGNKTGPNLNRIKAKTTPEFLYAWIKDPHKVLPKTRMPYFPDFGADPAAPDYEQQREKEVMSLVAFLWKNSEDGYPAKDADTRSDSWFTGGNAEHGEKLFNSVGCKACHVATSDFQNARPEGYYKFDNPFYKEFDQAPNLYTVGSKVNAKWLYHWLKNPSGYSHDTAMPSLRLSDDEARDLTTWLMTQKGKEFPQVEGLTEALSNEEMIKKGEWIVRNYGCFGCHSIKGMEKEQKVAPELTTFALKGAHELAFGPRNAADVPRTWEDWFLNKVKAPRGYRDERNLQKMPQFGYQIDKDQHGFSDEQAHRLMTLVKGFNGQKLFGQWPHGNNIEQKTVEKGRRLVEYYNCKACHIIDRKGGRVLGYYEENLRLGPPDLTFVGAKLQPEWFAGFLRNPSQEIRPWLQIRMPTFGFEGTDHVDVANYFAAVSGHLTSVAPPEPESLNPESVALGKKMFEQNACMQCHQVNPKVEKGVVGQVAPNLQLAYQRLQPEWIQRFVRNPVHMYPGLIMPAFWSFPQTEDGLPIYDPAKAASEDDQAVILQNWKELQGIADWLMVFGRPDQAKDRVGRAFNAEAAAAKGLRLPAPALQKVTGKVGHEPGEERIEKTEGDSGGSDMGF